MNFGADGHSKNDCLNFNIFVLFVIIYKYLNLDENKNEEINSRRIVKPFTKQHGRQLRRIASIFTKTLTYLSGGEPEALLKYFLEKNPTIQIKKTENIRGVLSSVQGLHMTTNNTREKNKYLSLVAPHFPKSFLKSVGFKFSSSSFASARKKKFFENRHFIPPSKTPITINQKRKINEFLIENSTIASNKSKKIKLADYYMYWPGILMKLIFYTV